MSLIFKCDACKKIYDQWPAPQSFQLTVGGAVSKIVCSKCSKKIERFVKELEEV